MPATSACYLEVGTDNIYQFSVCQLLLIAPWKLDLTTSTNYQCAYLPAVSVPAPFAYYLDVGSDNTYKLSVCQLLLLATWKLELTTSTNSQCANYYCY
jgi:hypothetical protein